MCWWDAGNLIYMIDARALAAGRFDATYACIDTS
jgi:hypothetical protein